jgi:hypothetical protein
MNAANEALVTLAASAWLIAGETGAIPDPIAAFWARTALAVAPVTPAAASFDGNTDPTVETRIEPSTAVPSTPPS